MDKSKNDTAIVFIDPQNEVLSEKGPAWGLVGGSVMENNTIENMERIFKAARANGFEVFISPHYFFPTDSERKSTAHWRPTRPTKMFLRSGRLNLEGSPALVPTGSSASSPTLKTARPSS
jgi:nicotinamidase-related amidase